MKQITWANKVYSKILNIPRANKVTAEDMNETKDVVNSNAVFFNTKGSTQTFTVAIANLQATIDSLPKLLNYDVIINVNAGTYVGTITIANFFGNGSITINGNTTSVAGTTTHNITNMILQYNYIEISTIGINCTNTTGNSFYFFHNTGYTTLSYCNAINGLNSTTNNIGVNVGANTGMVAISFCTFSNKYYAHQISLANKLAIYSPSGTGNNIVNYAVNGGIIHRRNLGTIIGITLNSYATGGLIVNPTGGIIGT